MNNIKITIIIPALNEDRSIENIITKCKRYSNEIIVTDGGSKDKTIHISQNLGARVINNIGRGKGLAIRHCINHINGDITVFIDADGSHDPHDIPKLIQPIKENKADHVSGSRLLGGSSELHGGFDEFLRLAGSSFITACINKRFNLKLSDSQNGFRAIRTSVLKKLDLKENTFTIEQEMIVETAKKGFRIAEVPTHEYKREFGKSHICLFKVWYKYLFSLIRLLFIK
ncbi:MAG: glycosyltransferase family 2 protein [Candidatus Hodarchaeota archaeon]